MLQAIKNKKAGRNFKGTEIQWSTLFEGSEDSLTSSVVGTLLYLPHTILWTIFNRAFGQNTITIDEPIEDFVFWPSWNSEYTDNTNFVEPDVFIQTPKYHIIIEAKKTDGIGQDIDQWERELIAYQNEYSNEGTKLEVVFIALGGVPQDKIEPIELTSTLLPNTYQHKYTVIQLQWKTLLKACLDQKYALESMKEDNNHSSLRILNDVIEYFEVHKVYRLKHFIDIIYPKYIVKDYELSAYKLKIETYESR